jgi:hypothetical protein
MNAFALRLSYRRKAHQLAAAAAHPALPRIRVELLPSSITENEVKPIARMDST